MSKLQLSPAHTGKLGFHLSAVDAQVEDDAPTFDILLCKSKNNVAAEYALRDTQKPVGIADYQLIESLPKDLETSLRSIEQLERESRGAG